MLSRTDWLATNRTKLVLQAKRTNDYLKIPDNQIRMGLVGINLDFYKNVFATKYSDFVDAFQQWKEPPEKSPSKSIRLRNAEKIFKPVYRQLYMSYLRNNPNVTDFDLEAMGLPKRSSGNSPVLSPETCPEV
ncbi:MAG: hypothetical protein LBL94_11360 [Prevotellaceae bacterium]|jgi:hypothetical protein|nr:hypothetical protein [Prevotellaceae bacterium]